MVAMRETYRMACTRRFQMLSCERDGGVMDVSWLDTYLAGGEL